ncbi:hypothetical protein GY45DRAFT_1314512 [Cubamyces sp. BRFM 1775]|nr:hypothetical protein GY45DRAFT_1314512 [Cubamyces sp. BRFM 1775]
MARGRKANSTKVRCDRCGREFLQNGIASHQRACERQLRVAEGGRQLVGGYNDAPEGSGQAANLGIDYEEDVSPNEELNEDPRGPPWAIAVPLDGVALPAMDVPPALDILLAVDVPPGADAPPLGVVFEDDANANTNADANANANANVTEGEGGATSTSESVASLRLPTFRAPTLINAPMLSEDDFLVVRHPHAQVPPFIKPFEEFNRGAPDVDPARLPKNPTEPFDSVADFEFAEIAADAALSQKHVNRLLSLIGRVANGSAAISFRTYRDMKKAWDVASYQAPTYVSHSVVVPYKNEDRTYAMHARDPFEWGISLVKDPLLAPQFVWNSQRLYKYNGTTWERFVDEPDTADRWWEVESALPADGNLLGYILYADKTRLSSFGTQKGYPIMARLANLPARVRNSDGHGGGQIIGFLPIVEDEKEEGKKGFTNHKRAVWHSAFEILLERIRTYGKIGYKCECGDGVLRVLYPIILMLVADYEEQAVMSLIHGPNGLCPCPVCEIPANEQQYLSIQPTHPARDPSHVQAIVEDASLNKAQMEEVLKPMGIRPLKNVFWTMPHCNVYKALSWDRLHAYHGGLFSDHLFAQFQDVVSKLGRPAVAQVNDQFNAIPRWPNLNHFAEVAAVNFTDGTKYEDISKVIVPASYNVFPQSTCPRGYILLKCLRCYIVLDVLSGLEVHLASTMELYAKGLIKFSDTIKYGEEHPEKNWNFPKGHTQQHVLDDIGAKGVTKNFNGKLFEKLHGPVKEIYDRQTNFKNVDVQIAEIEHRRMVAQFIRAHLDAVNEAAKQDQADTTTRKGSLQFSHIRLGSLITQTFADLEKSRTADPIFTRFRLRLEAYLNRRYASTAWVRLKAEDEISVSRYIQADYESRVGFAQLRLVFICEFEKTAYPIALVSNFDVATTRIPAMDADLGLHRVRQSADPVFIPATSIIRGALLSDAFTAGQRDRFVIDTVDGDMFLRLGQDVPAWKF